MKHATKFVTSAWFAFLLIILWMVTAPLMGCSTKKNFTSSQTVKDSTWVKKTVKPFDTLVKVPGNKVEVSAKLDELMEGKHFENTSKNLTASLRRDGDKIIANCDQAELEMIISLQKELLEVYRSKETTTKEAETVVETIKQTPWYLVPFLWLGAFYLLRLIFKAVKTYFFPVKTIV